MGGLLNCLEDVSKKPNGNWIPRTGSNLSHVKTYVCLVKTIPCSLFLSVEMVGSYLHDITAKLMNLNVAKQNSKTQKITHHKTIWRIGFSRSHGYKNSWILCTTSWFCYASGFMSNHKTKFQDGELGIVNNTQGPLLLILHLTNMSPQCKVNPADDLNQNRVYKAWVMKGLIWKQIPA